MTAPPFTVAEIEQAASVLRRLSASARNTQSVKYLEGKVSQGKIAQDGGDALDLFVTLAEALQSGDVAILTRYDREQAIIAAVMCGTNQMSEATHKTGDFFKASAICEHTARTLLQLPVEK